MRRLFGVSLLTWIVTPALAASAPQQSWGKAGITLTQYRQDALECGLKGYYTDVSQTQDAKELVRASRQLDNLQSTFGPGSGAPGTASAGASEADQMGEYAATQEHIVDSARPELRYRNIKNDLQTTTAQCLVQRGYSKFTLTGEQRHRLSKLKAGSNERREYLYSLASNASVLQAQKAPAQP